VVVVVAAELQAVALEALVEAVTVVTADQALLGQTIPVAGAEGDGYKVPRVGPVS